MKFTYQNEQPSPHFTNDKLNIAGAFWWATGLRDIPKVAFLPDTIKKILRPISKEHGPVLFSAFNPAATEYRNAKYIQVTKSEVRRWHKHLEPFFEVVLVSEKPCKRDTVEYKPVGITADGSFKLYFRQPELHRNSYWVMETIAADEDMYYTFVVLMSKHYNMGDPATASYQSKLFIEDVQQYFEKPEQPSAVQSSSRTKLSKQSSP
jgi:hypothetical protein